MKRFAVFVLLAAFLAGCAPRGPQRYARTYYEAFDTVVSLTVFAQEEPDFSAFEEELTRLDAIFDRYEEHPGVNGLWALNASGGEWIAVAPELYDLLALNRTWREAFGDRVNPGMGNVFALWREYRERGEGVPGREELALAAAHADYADLELKDGRARLADSEMSVDLGASAKGYAAGLLRDWLAENYDSFLLDMGGNITCRGEKGDGSGAWRVGVRAPETGGILRTLAMADLTASTSAGDQRYYEWEGAIYHHLIDPETLYPANNLKQATVLCEDAGLADYLSTLLFLTPPEEAMALAEEIPGVEAILVLNDGEVRMSGSAEKRVTQ